MLQRQQKKLGNIKVDISYQEISTFMLPNFFCWRYYKLEKKKVFVKFCKKI
jgi:hypothetical protein